MKPKAKPQRKNGTRRGHTREAINLSLPVEVIEELRSIAERQDRPVSRVAAALLREALSEAEAEAALPLKRRSQGGETGLTSRDGGGTR